MAVPASMEKVTKVDATKPSARSASSNNQKENKNRKTNMEVNTIILALVDAFEAFSLTRNTSNGETYQVLSKGKSANKTDINKPKKTPINMG
jgi:hypothetical protein